MAEQNVSVLEDNIEVSNNQEPFEKLKMSGTVGNIGQFDESIEQVELIHRTVGIFCSCQMTLMSRK